MTKRLVGRVMWGKGGADRKVVRTFSKGYDAGNR